MLASETTRCLQMSSSGGDICADLVRVKVKMDPQSVRRVKVRSSSSGAAADYTSADRETLQANQNKGN